MTAPTCSTCVLAQSFASRFTAAHLDLSGELNRINSHICSIAYPILESAVALLATRVRSSWRAELDEARP